jgi:hypothetical protein
MANKAASVQRWQRFADEFKNKVDFSVVYSEVGCTPVGTPNHAGWQKCLSHESFGGQDKHASASYNVYSGFYHDFRTGEKYGVCDFIVAIGGAGDWRAAQSRLARRFGVKIPRKMDSDPLKDMGFLQWEEFGADQFCRAKPPVTKEALEKISAGMCTYRGMRCLRFTVYGLDYETLGYQFIPVAGIGFEGEEKQNTKCYPNAIPGFLGKPALDAIMGGDNMSENDQTPTIVWTEGTPDMLAGYSRITDGLFLTNTSGVQETTKANREAILKRTKPHVIHIIDADEPGIAGGLKRAKELEDLDCVSSVTVYHPPYKIEAKSGKDLRDFLHENPDITTMDQLMPKLVKLERVEPVKLEAQAVANRRDIINEQTNESLQFLTSANLQIVGTDDQGSVVLRSHNTGRVFMMKRLTDLTYMNMLALCGPDFGLRVENVTTEADLQLPNTIMFSEFKRKVAIAMSTVKTVTAEPIGQGLWMLGKHPHDEKLKCDLYVVKNGVIHRYTGKKLVPTLDTSIGNYTLSYGKLHSDWFDLDKLNKNIERAASVEWRRKAYFQLYEAVNSWAWENDRMGMVACGLIYSSWLQSALPWRPTITLVGESDSGKTWFLTMLSEIYLLSTVAYGKSSAAGVLQRIGHNCLPTMIDEIDQTKGQLELLSTLRGSSRGQPCLKGTSNQDGKVYTLQHTPWLSGIFTSAESIADKNRLIELSLKAVTQNTIKRPELADAMDLGYKILASVIVCSKDIISACREMLKVATDKAGRSRYRESYAIPYGTLAAVCGFPPDDLSDDMNDYIKVIEGEWLTDGSQNDQEDALGEIMGSVIKLGYGSSQSQASVAEILTSPNLISHRKTLETMGVVRKHIKLREHLVMHIKTLVGPHGVLKDSRIWKGNSGLRQVLKRLKKLSIVSCAVHIAGQTHYCLCMDWTKVENWLKKNPDLFGGVEFQTKRSDFQNPEET